MLKPYRTWTVEEYKGEVSKYSKPWYVLEMNPKKRRKGAASARGFEIEEAARIYAAMRTDEDMENERQKSMKRKERAQAKRSTPNPFCAGMIFTNSWGYDQTNVDYYQVTRTTPRGVYIRPIAGKSVVGSGGFMSDSVVPDKDNFTGDEQFKPIQSYSDGKAYISATHGCMSLTQEWEANYRSWYA